MTNAGKDTLLSLIDKGEGQFLEFKSIWDRSTLTPKKRDPREVAWDVAETLDAMANADGGTVLLGVEDYKDITGVDYSLDVMDKFSSISQRHFKHPVSVRFEKILFNTKLVLKFDVDSSPIPVQLVDGRYLFRIGEQDIPYPAGEIAKLKSAKTKAFYEREFVYGATFTDLDDTLIKKFLSRIGETREGVNVLHRPYRLIDFQNGSVRVTKMALLLFGKDPLKWHPRCDIDFIKYEGTKRKTGADLNIIKRIRIQSPLIELVDKAFETIKAHVKERVILHDLFFREKFEYPTFAWQEALINAIAHRDYSLEGISIEIEMFDDRLEIKSPGKLPESVSISRLLKREPTHFSRNPLLVRVFTDLGYMREKGEGIPRIFNEMEKNYLQPPELKGDTFSFCVILKNIPIYDEETQRWLENYRKYPLNMRQRQALAYAYAHGMRLSIRVYRKLCKVNRDLAYQEIRELLKLGILNPIRKKRTRSYMLVDLQAKKLIREDLLDLAKIIKGKGYITNEDARRIFGCSRPTAIRKLKELIKEGLLEQEGKKGRGVKYRPTSAFTKATEMTH